MNPSIYVPIIALFIVLYVLLQNKRKIAVIRKIIKKRKKEGNQEMKALAEKFIEKDCLIYSFDGSHQYEGIIKEVSEGAILIEKDGKQEAINLDFVIRIREYPINKNGKRKSVVLD